MKGLFFHFCFCFILKPSCCSNFNNLTSEIKNSKNSKGESPQKKYKKKTFSYYFVIKEQTVRMNVG